MRFSTSHVTQYRYSAPVRFSPHRLRLAPRPDGIVLHEQSLRVGPMPTSTDVVADPWGNAVTRVDFDGEADSLRIESRFVVETAAPPPPADRGLPPLPWPVPPRDRWADFRPAGFAEASVGTFAADLARDVGWSALAFVERLNRVIHTDIRHDIRDGGAARSPAETLAVGHGACRDVTVLFLAAARSLGLAARFVSGYQAEADTPDGRRHLHAWPEVFLPGSGWHGFDPTHGLAVGDGHVALCAAPDQASTMPVEGGFWGSGVTSTLDYDVTIATAP